MTSTLPKGTLGSVVSLLATTLYQGNTDRNHKLGNIVSTLFPGGNSSIKQPPPPRDKEGGKDGYIANVPGGRMAI
jgi:hypothetical protein